MDIKSLKQYRAITREIEALEQRLVKLQKQESKYVADSVISASEFPYTKHTVVIRGYDVTRSRKISNVEARLSKRKMTLACELEEIEAFIDTIEDSEMRQIIQCRYIDGFSWQQIAFNIGYQDESVPRKKHNRFLK